MKKVHADDRENYFLPLTKVKKLDKWLLEKYSIDCVLEFDKYYASRGRGAPQKELIKVDRLLRDYVKFSKAENESKKSKLGLELANIFAKEGWREWWHSNRRAWLIDSISISSSIISSISKNQKDLNVLDIGCNIGILSNYLAENYSVNLTGIDSSEVAIAEANKFKKVMNATFQHTDVEDLSTESHWDVAIAVDLVQPIEPNFLSLFEKVGNLVKPNGHMIVVGNFLSIENIDEFFRSIGFSCLSAQLTGGYQRGHSEDFGVDWSPKAALHFKKNLKLKSVSLPISGDMNDFAAYANSGEFPQRELNRSYFLPRVGKNLIRLD